MALAKKSMPSTAGINDRVIFPPLSFYMESSQAANQAFVGPDHASLPPESMFPLHHLVLLCPLSLHSHWYKLRAHSFGVCYLRKRTDSSAPFAQWRARDSAHGNGPVFTRRCRCCMRLRSRSRTVTWQR